MSEASNAETSGHAHGQYRSRFVDCRWDLLDWPVWKLRLTADQCEDVLDEASSADDIQESQESNCPLGGIFKLPCAADEVVVG